VSADTADSTRARARRGPPGDLEVYGTCPGRPDARRDVVTVKPVRAAAPGPVCRCCPARLVRVADPRTDTWLWADESGSCTGTDGDLAHIPDPHGHLADLDRMARAGDMRAGREYAALSIRLTTGYHHEHYPADLAGLPPHEGPVPEHCGWPAWLRPSGWQCRRCGERLPVPGGSAEPVRRPARQPVQTRPRTGPVRGRRRTR
jgi:hypothetical protein